MNMKIAVFAALVGCIGVMSVAPVAPVAPAAFGQSVDNKTIKTIKTIKDVPSDGKVHAVDLDSGSKHCLVRISSSYNEKRVLAETDTGYSPNAKPTDISQAVMSLSAMSITDREGYKEKSLRILLGKTTSNGVSGETYTSVPLQKIDAVSNKLHDALRISKAWERQNGLKKSQSLNFDLMPHLSLSMHEDKGNPYSFSMELTYGSFDFGFYSHDHYSGFLTLFDEYAAWVKEQ